MDDPLAGTLRDVGEALDLSEYELRTYVAVVEHGRMTPRDIASAADIPQPRVYDTVRNLADRNLVELRETRPMEVIPVPPSDAFDEVRSQLDDAVETLEERYIAPTTDDEAAFLVKSRGSILRYLGDVIQEAESELTMALPPELLDRFADELADAKDRGATITLLVAPGSEAPDPGEYDYGAVATEAKGRRGVTTPVIAVADWAYGMYTVPRAVRSDGNGYGVIFNRSALGFLVLGFFGTVLWSTANRTLYDRREAVDFPSSYGSIRRCIKDIQFYGGPVNAEITGRDVDTGDDRTVAGRVVETTLTADESVAALVLETEDGRVDVGGLMATYEDIEARRITVTTRV